MKKKQADKRHESQDVLFGVFSLEENERRRQQRMLHWFTWLLVPYDFIYANIWLHSPDFKWYGWILFTSGVFSFLSWALYFWHRNVTVAKAGVTISALFNLPALLLFPSIARTGIYWMALFPPLTYLYQGVFLGNIYNGLFVLIIVAIQVLNGKGIIPLEFTQVEMGQMWSELIVMIVLGHAAEAGWTKSRRLLAAQRERLRTLIANLPTGVVMVEKDGTPSAFNASVEALFGRPIDPKTKAAQFGETYHLSQENGAPILTEDQPLPTALSTGNSVTKSGVFVRRPDGSNVVLRIAAAPILDDKGKVSAAVAVYEDMTKEHEIDQMKSEFVSLASHQLKTPLTSIKWSVESLLEGESGKLSEAQGKSVHEIEAVADRLMRLVGDLLSVSRIETGQKFNLVRQPTDVAPILKAVMAELAMTAAQRKITLTSPSLPEKLMLDVDQDKFREVFTNLVGNAIKYSREGGKVEIGLAKAKSGESELFVKDDGLGIPKAQQPKVFGKFFRAANVSEDIEGTGLGLYIVKAVVEKHDGRVWFDSEEGKGTTFHVVLPAAKA